MNVGHGEYLGEQLRLDDQRKMTTQLWHLQRCSVCDPANLFLKSKFSYLPFLFPTTPTIKLKLDYKYRGRLLIAKHHDWPIRNREQQSYHIYYNLLQHVGLCCALALANCEKKWVQNHFSGPNQHVLTFLHLILICRIAC